MSYTFNTEIARHLFCSVYSVKPFYVPRSHPQGYSVNLHCIDPEMIEALDIHMFDGRNWEKHIGNLASLGE